MSTTTVPKSGQMSPIPRLQKAIVGASDAALIISNEAPVPEIEGEWILVRTKAISINPIDAKMIGAKSFVTPGAVLGCDFAGDVVRAGSKAVLKVGERVCGALMGMNPLLPEIGAFAEYTAASSTHVLRMPDKMSYAEAATIGTCFLTAALALFYSLGLAGSPANPIKSHEPFFVLVSGGASASGTAALQLLRLAGYTPIATSSTRHFDLCKSYGAETMFEYKSPTCAEDIRKHTKNSLGFALDCITTLDSMRLCYGALGRAGGFYTALDPYHEQVASTRKRVKADWIFAATMMGQEIAWPEPYYRAIDPNARDFGSRFRPLVEKLFADGKLNTHTINIRVDGLEGALEGLEEVRKGNVRGEKLVYLMGG